MLVVDLGHSAYAQTGTTEVLKPAYELSANRSLSAAEVAKIHQLSDIVIDKSLAGLQRRSAAKSLGLTVPHKIGIPALLAVLRDESDERDVRYACLTALSRITDERVINYLIETLSDDDARIASRAERQLWKLTDQQIPLDIHAEPEVRSRQAEGWRDWWDKNRGKAQIFWWRAHVEMAN